MDATIKIDAWVARDRFGSLYLYVGGDEPEKDKDEWTASGGSFFKLPTASFPSVQWTDEKPLRAIVTIQPDPQQQ